LKGFLKWFFRVVVHIHASRKKNQVQRSKLAWIPKFLPSFYFIFFRESFFLKQSDFFSIYCSPNFYHFSKTQTRLRLYCMNKALGHLVECTKCTFETRLMTPLYVMQILLFEALLSLSLSPAWTWGFYPTNLKSFL
jgi:hypothetical protein